MFTKSELEVMSQLLDLASEKFSNRGCNDFELPATEENIAFIKEAEPEFEPNVHRGKIMGNDSDLMLYLRDRCKEELSKLP